MKYKQYQKTGQYEYDIDNKVWDVRIDKYTEFSCKTQYEAEILSQLIQIKQLLIKRTD